MLNLEAALRALRTDRELLGDVYSWQHDALLAPPPPAIWNPWGDVIPPVMRAPEQEEEYPSSEFATITLKCVTLRVVYDPKPAQSR